MIRAAPAAEPRGVLPAALDTALDRAIAPGYSRIGYALRSRAWADSDPPADALSGKVVAITGATSGIGRAGAEGAKALGASVLLIGRDAEKTRRLARALDAEVELADMSLLASVRDLAGRLRERELHALVHNAGVMTRERVETREGNEVTFATHVLGPHLLSRLLQDAPPARTIWVSSGGMYAQRLDPSDIDRGGVGAYARTKRMQVVLAELWAQRLGPRGVVHAMHPGWVDTPGLAAGLATFHRLTGPILRPPAEGADTIVWLTAADEPGRSSGRFWHDRRQRPTHYLARTRERASDRDALWAACERLTAD
jgi:NAD(P)-dependent dehydrogenase (short-subunit alcohol dehydrogenase family)